MPRNTKLPQINLVVSPVLYSAAHKAARAADKSFSEWVRDALRAYLGDSEDGK